MLSIQTCEAISRLVPPWVAGNPDCTCTRPRPGSCRCRACCEYSREGICNRQDEPTSNGLQSNSHGLLQRKERREVRVEQKSTCVFPVEVNRFVCKRSLARSTYSVSNSQSSKNRIMVLACFWTGSWMVGLFGLIGPADSNGDCSSTRP